MSPLRLAARAMTIGLLALPALALSCGDGDPTAVTEDNGFPPVAGAHPASCAGFAARLRACGLLTEGRFGCTDPVDAIGTCVFGCITASSCELLWEVECQGLPQAIDRCFDECQLFSCGDGSSVPSSWICDGEADCLNGSDELNCGNFTCDSGQQIPLSFRCDFYPDCFDGSDETGCPGFECGSGDTIPEQLTCDGYPHCFDGSDEIRCPIFTCIGDGSTVPLDWQCDQEHDCLDGSDEYGCAALLCR